MKLRKIRQCKEHEPFSICISGRNMAQYPFLMISGISKIDHAHFQRIKILLRGSKKRNHTLLWKLLLLCFHHMAYSSRWRILYHMAYSVRCIRRLSVRILFKTSLSSFCLDIVYMNFDSEWNFITASLKTN